MASMKNRHHSGSKEIHQYAVQAWHHTAELSLAINESESFESSGREGHAEMNTAEFHRKQGRDVW
jgi:hypothetical protein